MYSSQWKVIPMKNRPSYPLLSWYQWFILQVKSTRSFPYLLTLSGRYNNRNKQLHGPPHSNQSCCFPPETVRSSIDTEKESRLYSSSRSFFKHWRSKVNLIPFSMESGGRSLLLEVSLQVRQQIRKVSLLLFYRHEEVPLTCASFLLIFSCKSKSNSRRSRLGQ